MPTTPYAKILVSVNAGPAASGGLTVSNGDTIQLSAESTVGWVQQTWEIYSFYSTAEFPLPAGWIDAGNGVYRYMATVTPPPFTLPAAPAFGKWLLGLTVNGGTINGVFAPTLIDKSSALLVLSASGLEDIAYLEGQQFNAVKKWVGALQRSLRVLEALTGGFGVATPLAIPGTIASRGGSADTAFGLVTTPTIEGTSAAPLEVTIPQAAGTGATTAEEIRIDGQIGRAQTGVNNNNDGGNIRIRGGVAGSGGGGSPGFYGLVSIESLDVGFAVRESTLFSGFTLYNVGTSATYMLADINNSIFRTTGFVTFAIPDRGGGAPGPLAGHASIFYDDASGNLKYVTPGGATKTITAV